MMTQSNTNPSRPLFVDLDGTLIDTDTLTEALLLLTREMPWQLPRVFYQLITARARGKRQISELGFIPHAASLPYRDDVMEFVRQEKAKGRPVILATATDARIADAVAAHVPEFEEVLASDGETNLKSRAKLKSIRAWCARHDCEDFAYAGDSRADLTIWEEAAEVIAVNPSAGVKAKIQKHAERLRLFEDEKHFLGPVLRVLRPFQWTKNLLLFLPLLLAHEWRDASRMGDAVIAFVVFCLCASSIYVFNDVLDMPFDRQHPIKRRRPFAASQLDVTVAPMLIGILLFTAAGISFASLPASFLVIIAVYVGSAIAYSIGLKRLVVIDVLMLAGFYVLRILAGGRATELYVSEWLFAFSGFMFLSLAFTKRYAELDRTAAIGDGHSPPGRGYQPSDLLVLGSVGPTSGYLAALVMALYVNSDPVRELYQQPKWLWLICPLILYWVTRIWILARRGELPEDPLVFAFCDKVSWCTGAVAVGVVLLAMIG